jgi:hypothetical protein
LLIRRKIKKEYTPGFPALPTKYKENLDIFVGKAGNPEFICDFLVVIITNFCINISRVNNTNIS